LRSAHRFRGLLSGGDSHLVGGAVAGYGRPHGPLLGGLLSDVGFCD
jgi:hypothetical protein